MKCLHDLGNGNFTELVPQPQVFTECMHVVGNPSEFQQSNSPFNISVADALQLSGAIALVWAVAFVGRVSIKALNIDEKGDSKDG